VSGTTISVGGYLVLLVVGLALEVRGRRSPEAVTAVQALGAAMRTAPGRAAVLAVWLWLGVHFLAR
jgi:hypothetical protein